jgi:hypothetical protein
MPPVTANLTSHPSSCAGPVDSPRQGEALEAEHTMPEAPHRCHAVLHHRRMCGANLESLFLLRCEPETSLIMQDHWCISPTSLIGRRHHATTAVGVPLPPHIIAPLCSIPAVEVLPSKNACACLCSRSTQLRTSPTVSEPSIVPCHASHRGQGVRLRRLMRPTWCPSWAGLTARGPRGPV